jgi:hypothetical protein
LKPLFPLFRIHPPWVSGRYDPRKNGISAESRA